MLRPLYLLLVNGYSHQYIIIALTYEGRLSPGLPLEYNSLSSDR